MVTARPCDGDYCERLSAVATEPFTEFGSHIVKVTKT
jgi:hypothetical protein